MIYNKLTRGLLIIRTKSDVEDVQVEASFTLYRMHELVLLEEHLHQMIKKYIRLILA
ncbi:unnamed protein product [Amoebophrya sp. A25]|nr:unnamed protein product [Amoebophrya sp. A25]|eukprot:GSA25T00011969001.1